MMFGAGEMLRRTGRAGASGAFGTGDRFGGSFAADKSGLKTGGKALSFTAGGVGGIFGVGLGGGTTS